VLVVEDESLVALLMAEQLAELGYTVIGPAFTMSEARRLASLASIDAALVDLNLHGILADEIADILARRENILQDEGGLVPINPPSKQCHQLRPKIFSVAPTLSSRYLTAIIPLDGRSDHAAVLPRTDGYAARTDADGEITVSPVSPLTAVTIDPIIPVTTNLHVHLCHFEGFGLGVGGSNE
jgi:CheY-like chemotaxis protein